MGILHRYAIHVALSVMALSLGEARGGGAGVAEVSRAERESGSCPGKVTGEVVEDGERGMGDGDSGARVVLADRERA